MPSKTNKDVQSTNEDAPLDQYEARYTRSPACALFFFLLSFSRSQPCSYLLHIVAPSTHGTHTGLSRYDKINMPIIYTAPFPLVHARVASRCTPQPLSIPYDIPPWRLLIAARAVQVFWSFTVGETYPSARCELLDYKVYIRYTYLHTSDLGSAVCSR